MSKNKQSSIDWFVEKLGRYNEEIVFLYQNEIEQAKAMHRQEHENTWIDSRIEDKGDDYIGKQKSFNEYYNETFNNDAKK